MSILLRAACTGLAALVVIVALVAIVAAFAGRMTSVNDGSQTFVISQLGRPSRLILGLVAAATAGVDLKAVRIISGGSPDNYSRRECSRRAPPGRFASLASVASLWGVLKLVWTFLLLVLLKNPPRRSFAGSVDALVMGAVIVGISWFAEMATNLREENDLTI